MRSWQAAVVAAALMGSAEVGAQPGPRVEKMKAPVAGKKGKFGGPKGKKPGKAGKAGKASGPRGAGGPGRPGGSASAGSGGGRTTRDAMKAAGFLQLRSQQFRLAVEASRTALEKGGTEADLLVYATACARLGDFTTARGSGLGLDGVDGWDLYGMRGQADALLALGDAAAARALRRSRLVDPLGDAEEMTIHLTLLDDALAAGDLEAAAEALSWAEAVAPDAPAVHGAAAELALVEGRWDDAEAALWLAAPDGARSTAEYTLSAGRVALALGDLDAAEDLTRALMRGNPRDPRAIRLRAEVLLSEGDAAGALSLLNRNFARTWGELWHPELLAVEAVALHHHGDTEGARAALGRARTLYPASPFTASAAVWLAAPPQGPGR
jgi:tetratricopeptide (TPR) repeat protein